MRAALVGDRLREIEQTGASLATLTTFVEVPSPAPNAATAAATAAGSGDGFGASGSDGDSDGQGAAAGTRIGGGVVSTPTAVRGGRRGLQVDTSTPENASTSTPMAGRGGGGGGKLKLGGMLRSVAARKRAAQATRSQALSLKTLPYHLGLAIRQHKGRSALAIAPVPTEASRAVVQKVKRMMARAAEIASRHNPAAHAAIVAGAAGAGQAAAGTGVTGGVRLQSYFTADHGDVLFAFGDVAGAKRHYTKYEQ